MEETESPKMNLGDWLENSPWAWGVWIGGEYVVSYYDGMHDVMDRKTGKYLKTKVYDLPGYLVGEYYAR